MHRRCIGLIAACATMATWAPPASAWTGARACPSDGGPWCLAVDAPGDIYVTGAAADGARTFNLLAKYDGRSGAQGWSSTIQWGGLAYAVRVDLAGNPVIAGQGTSVRKFDGLSGTRLWDAYDQVYPPSAARALALDAAGDVYVASTEEGMTGTVFFSYYPRTVLRKFDGASGGMKWRQAYDHVGEPATFLADDTPNSIRIDAGGNAVVARSAGKSVKDAIVMLKDGWESVVGSTADSGFHDAIPSASGAVFAVGFTDDTNGLAVRLNGGNGVRVWTTVSAAAGRMRAAAIDGDGNLLVAGGNDDLVVTKLSAADGSIIWQNTYSTEFTDVARAILVDETGDAYVAGNTGSDAIVARFRGTDGARLWSRVVDVASHIDTFGALAWLPGGDFVAAGTTEDQNLQSDILLQRLTRSGETVWKSGYARAPLAMLGAGSVAFDPQPVGTTSPAKIVLLTNTGSADLHIAAVAASGDYSVQGCGAGTVLAGGVSCLLTISFSPTASGARTGSIAVTDNAAGSPHTIALSGTGLENPPRATALSTRMQVLTGDDVLIGGFIVGGAVPKTVIVRARGPSLASQGVADPLADPELKLFSAAGLIAANDDWAAAPNAADVSASGLAPANAKESAILATLPPGAYTAIVSGSGSTTGVGIVEVYEIDHPEVPLTAISTRGRVQTGDNVMIGGFIVNGSGPQTVVVRARGPSLASNGIADPLANPTLTLVGNGFTLTNDDWATAPNAAQIQSSGFAPRDSRESAMLVTLGPGAYTAIVAGVGGATGVAIVEVFAQ